jgi:flagellar M-ring protein FliF
MAMSDYWGALSPRQKIGLTVSCAAIVAATAALGFWAMRDPMVLLASGLPAERQAVVARELERDKIAYRFGEDGNTIYVPASAIGKARVSLSGGSLGLPPTAGLEIFKEADFSTTDFAQRINYQRALQGELTRTLQNIAGVRSARVHVILPEGGLLKRNDTKASVGVTLQIAPGNALTHSQVNGIQHLIAASVPDIQPGEVVVVDESGNTLSRNASEAEGEASDAQLDLKRQVDNYLEGKLTRLLSDLVPRGQVTLSVDTSLDFKQLKVTTDEPLVSAGKDGDHPTGVVVKERQSQRENSDSSQVRIDSSGTDTSDSEYEYKVGHRLEQSLSLPGAVKRISAAVAIQGAPELLTSAAVEQLVGHAVGIDQTRGDSVAVVLLPELKASSRSNMAVAAPVTAQPATMHKSEPVRREQALGVFDVPVMLTVLVLAILGGLWQMFRSMASRSGAKVDADAAAAKVRAWLSDGGAAR